jgi:hypothetical protein
MQKGNVIILILGIIAIGAGIFVRLEAKSFHKGARMTEGKVVHVIGTSFKISYFTEDGTEKTKQWSAKTHGRREGETLKVWYRTDNPDRARLNDGKKAGKTLFIAGAFCILMGIYPLFLKNKGGAQAPVV